MKNIFYPINYKFMLAGYILIITGLCLLSGPDYTEGVFNPEIFSFRRICAAPVITLSGFITILVGICYRKREKDGK